ncbi:disease resistance RPP8-like protein 3 [Eucalyptus grandis]|uniref:disease resistance RPP8-like protein 3 n=1 Tax=Eucalyptus grandis TaxID=71139 RepID=UPI00192EC7B1|nr:disease resistance RPP8-like protein 3 [Eucalyptus grandis]
MSELRHDPMLQLGRLSNLIVLRLLARSYTGESFADPQASVRTKVYREAGFPKLRVLKLWMLDKLDELVVEQGAMCNLEELEIRQCEKLGTVDALDHINSLKSVSLTGVDEDLAKHIKEKLKGRQHTLIKTKELVSKKESEFNK